MLQKGLLSPDQQNNPVFKILNKEKNFTITTQVADFIFVKQKITLLFIYLSYHEQHPHYILSKITELPQDGNTKVLLLLLDKNDDMNYINEIQFQLIPHNFKLFILWSYNEMADFIKKILEK